eukprot:scaffold48_cov311-Pinguiococcus_pyrenoidosus.AAC.329
MRQCVGSQRGEVRRDAMPPQRDEKEVHRHAAESELDHRRVGLRHRQHLRDLGIAEKRANKAAEEILARNMARRHTQHIHVGIRRMNAQAKAAKCAQLAATSIRQVQALQTALERRRMRTSRQLGRPSGQLGRGDRDDPLVAGGRQLAHAPPPCFQPFLGLQ